MPLLALLTLLLTDSCGRRCIRFPGPGVEGTAGGVLRCAWGTPYCTQHAAE
mgnify:CR=1 FL=1